MKKEPLIEFGLKNKTPTIVMSTLELYISLLENFGTKCLDLKALAPALIPLTENRTSSVRESNKNLIALILHWFGNNIKPLFSKIDETKVYFSIHLRTLYFINNLYNFNLTQKYFTIFQWGLGTEDYHKTAKDWNIFIIS